MANQTPSPSDEEKALVKGKLPRNALMSVGIATAVLIGSMAFYYELKRSNNAEIEAKANKAAQLKAGTADAPPVEDIDRIVRDQRARADAEAASAARAATSPSVKPVLTGDDFRSELEKPGGSDLSDRNKEDNIYTSSVFKQNAARNKAALDSATGLPYGVKTPADMLAAQQAAAAANGSAADQLALALGRQGQAPEDRDKSFLKDAAGQGGIVRTTFNGQAGKCTLTPPHNIHVKTVEGLNSDKPGRVALMVDEDVYDSVTGDCLMMPKGSFINGAYSSDIKVGQERLLVASTNLRLPNGKCVPLNGMQGADENGYAGFSGDVNNHFIKIFGAAFIIAALFQAFDKNSSTGSTAGPGGVTTYGSTAGQVAATTAQAVLNRNQNIPPTITVPPGQKFLIQVTQDIVMAPYHE